MTPGKLLVLIGDDEPPIRKVLGRVLETAGHRVVLATSGQEVLEHVERYKPDLVMLDLCMPGLPVKETLRCLLEAHPELPVIAMSGLDSDSTLDIQSSGVRGFLEKPFTRQILLAELERHFESEAER